MYTKKGAASIEKKDVKYIPAGINDDVVLKSAKFETSPSGKVFLEITFEKDGALLTHTEWKPTMGGFTNTPEALQTKEDNQYSRMLQILTCFYKNEEIDFNGETFEEFAKYVVDKLNNADKSVKLKIKVVYGDKGYTSLPKYAKYTFIEPMVLPEGKTSSITALGIDQFTKPVIVSDTENKVENPLDTTSNPVSFTNNDAEELPF